MRIGGLVFLIVGIVWMVQGADFVSGNTVMGQSQLFYIGIGTAIMGLALLTLSVGRPRDRK